MDIYFYLYKTSDPKIGTLKYGIREGSKIISRKSIGYKIPFKVWSEIKQRVKTTDLVDYVKINAKLDEMAQEFVIEPVSFVQTEDRDFFEFAADLISKQENVDTRKKYRTVLIDYKKFLLQEAKRDKFPIGEFRNPIWIENYKLFLKTKSIGYKGKKKKGYVIRNYILVLHSFVNNWNKYVGIKSPIPIQHFLNDTKNSDQVGHRALSMTELAALQGFSTESESQMNSKNLFLFQLFAGGMRVSDAFLMRFSAFRDGGLYYVMKKNKQQNYIDFDFSIAKTLQHFYPNEFEQAQKQITLSDLVIPANQVLKFFRRLNITEPDTVGLRDLEITLKALKFNPNRKNNDLISFFESLIVQMEKAVALSFHSILSKYGNRFVFPYLKPDEFSDLSSLEPFRMNEYQSDQLQKARSQHNSNLKRISITLKISKLSGHVPRHTFASIMLNEGSSVEQIATILGHTSFKTTQEYLKKFPEKLHKEALDKFRSAMRNHAAK